MAVIGKCAKKLLCCANAKNSEMGDENMKQKRKWLVFLLSLTLMLSLAVGVSAEEYPEEMDTSPYLFVHWLDNSGDGWFERYEDEGRWIGMTPYDEMWVTFYVNEWNGEQWVSTRVHPNDLYTNEYLYVTPVNDLDETQSIMPGEQSDYFVRITTGTHAWDQAGFACYDLNGQQLSVEFMVARMGSGFYTSQVMNNDTYFRGQFLVDPFDEENCFYYGTQDPNITLGEVRPLDNGDKINIERVHDKLYKFTVKPEFAQNIRWENFNFWFEVDEIHNAGTEDEMISTHNPDLWINCIEMDPPYYLRINESDYEIFEQGYLSNYFAGYGENEETGETWEIWKQQVNELPDGVSYDISTNTLTLNNAHLTQLEAGYAWYDEWSGEGGLNLPTQDLKIELVGENTIVNDHDRAVCFREGVNAIFTGDGSLYVKAVNSEDNTYQHYLNNENGPVLDENGDHKYILVPAQYPAMLIEGGATLIVAGNANVTAEIAGSAVDHCWEWNEELGYDEFIYTDRPAHLSAIAGNGNDLVLKENATLTTILPEGALYGGIKVETHTWIDEEGNERLDWHEGFGSYTGLNDFHNITVSDNAALNTTSFFVCDNTHWDDETQTEILDEPGRYTQTGGTVNITAMANRSKEERWGWNDETQRDEYLGIVDHYHYEGLNLRYADVNISGGELNIDAYATEEHLASSAWCEAIPVRGGNFNLSGGTVNINHNMGAGLVVGGYWNEWFDEGTGEVRGEGCRGGSANISGGELNINGTIEPYSEPFIVNAYGSLTLDGGEIHVNGKQSVIGGNVTVNDGSLNITAVNDTLDMAGCILILERDASLTVNGGAVNINAHNFEHALFNQGNLTQHGGIINAKSTCDEEWANFHGNEMGDGSINPFKNRGITSVGIITLDGGELNAEGYFGIWVGYEDGDPFNPEWGPIEDGGLYISDEAHANFTGLYRGLQIVGQCEINGGYVAAYAQEWQPVSLFDSSWDYWYWNEETQQDECIHFDNHSYLNITAGSHYFASTREAAEGEYLAGILSSGPAVTISGGEIEIDSTLAYYGINAPLRGTHYIVSMASGEKMEMLEEAETYIHPETGEEVTDRYYFMEEDNELGNVELNDYNYTGHVIILAHNQCGDNAYWNINDGVLTISGEGPIWDAYFMRADKPEEWAVTPWYVLKDHINEIVVEEGITSIPDWTFAHLDKVTKLTLPSTLTEMATYSILSNPELAEFVVAEGNELFKVYDKVSLVKGDQLIHVAPKTSGVYTVPECVVSTGDDSCIFTGITELYFAGDTKIIGNGSFSGITTLTKVVLPESVTTIGNGAFSGCTGLTEINIPQSVNSIGYSAFFKCDNLTANVHCRNEYALNFMETDELAPAYTVLHTEEILPAMAATCTEPGLTEGVICSACGDTLVAQEAIEAHGHKHGVSGFLPTCTEPGVNFFSCMYCDDYYEVHYEALGHDYQAVVTAPTCTEDGYTTYTCVRDEFGEVCGHTYVGDYTDALGHTEVTVPGKAPSETETGLTDGIKCSVCGEILKAQEVIDKLPPSHVHEYKAVVTEATCTEGGYTTYTCSCGESYIDNKTAAKGHSFGDWVTTVMPAVGKAGEQVRTCACGEKETNVLPALAESFTDVQNGEWYQDAVAWAATNGVTTGTTPETFSPLNACTRAQVVTFLWRAAGEPKPTSSNNPFTDVIKGEYYYDAVLWAVENGITNGMDATTFGTGISCNRGQVVTFLWRTAGKPSPTSSTNPFSDVASTAYYYEAVLWAVEMEITNGMSDTTFVPETEAGICNRAQIVTFLYRYTFN